MKKIIATFVLALAVSAAYAQKVKESEVPAAVISAFAKMYPGVKVDKWEKEDGNYEAEFQNNNAENSAVYTPDGALVMTEIEIPTTELPQGVHDYVKTNLGGKKISEASKIVSAAGVVTYEAEVGGKDYIFDADGKYLSTEAEDGDDEENGK